MFESARLKLTTWYLLIIMAISGFFSVAFYQLSTQEIQHVIDRITREQEQPDINQYDHRPTPPFSIEELEAVKNRIKLNLLFLNGLIFVFAGGAGYFLAGRTLRPIKEMVDEQNQFISSASHELRTPIATMRAEMEANLLEKQLSDKQARALITSNLEELTHLQELSEHLLMLAQVHSQTKMQAVSQTDLSAIVETAIKTVTPLAKKKEIAIEKKLINGKINADKKRLREVFIIILDNAIKYSPSQSNITITMHTTKKAFSVVITDQGKGISSKDLPHIFERFYRADTSHNEDGYGLGLSIAQQVISAHNGTIDVQSGVNKGTTFVVTLAPTIINN